MDAITESILEEIVKNVRLVHYWQTKKNIRHRNLKKIPKWGITDIFMYQLIPASAQFSIPPVKKKKSVNFYFLWARPAQLIQK